MVKLDEVQYDVGPTQHYARGDHAGIWARTRRQGRCFPEKSVSVSVTPWCCSGGESWGQCGSVTPGSPRPNPRRGVFLGGHPRFAFAEELWDLLSGVTLAVRSLSRVCGRFCSFVTVRPVAFLDTRSEKMGESEPLGRWL